MQIIDDARKNAKFFFPKLRSFYSVHKVKNFQKIFQTVNKQKVGLRIWLVFFFFHWFLVNNCIKYLSGVFCLLFSLV